MAEWNQKFDTFGEWVNKASSWLTRHPDYSREDWNHFTAICYDTAGRRLTCGGDFMRARDEGTFPVSWIWPDQVAALAALLDRADRTREVLELRDAVQSRALFNPPTGRFELGEHGF